MVGTIVALLVVNVLLLVAVAAAGWRYRDNPGARWFVLTALISAVWAALVTVSLVLPPGPLQVRVWTAGSATSFLSGVAWFGFVLAYTGRRRWLAPRRFAFAAAPQLLGAAVLLGRPAWFAGLTPTTMGNVSVVQTTVRPLGALSFVHLYAMLAIGLGLVVATVLDDESDLFTGQAVALVVGALVVTLSGAVRILELGPAPDFPILPFALGVEALLFGYAVLRHEFLAVVPAVRRIGERTAVESLEDGLLVVDDGTIVTANERAREVLGVEDPIGRSVDVLLRSIGDVTLSDLPARFERANRSYQATATPVRNQRDRVIGHTVLLRDVTDEVRRQQRLSVLNRILRHNLRNDVTVIRGSAESIAELTDGEADELAEIIARRADALNAVAEKARSIEGIFRDPSLRVTAVDLQAVVDDVVAPLAGQHHSAAIDVTVDADTLSTNYEVLALILENAVENALVHTGEAAHVAVTVEPADEGVRLTVEDDGPGIPDEELAPLRAGGENPLQHTSSLGLWLIYWGVQRLDGDLTIDTGGDGTTVTVTLPPLSDDAPGHATDGLGGPVGK